MPRGGRSLPALLRGVFAWAFARRLPVPGAPALVIDDSWHGAAAHGRLLIEGRLATPHGEVDLIATWRHPATAAKVAAGTPAAFGWLRDLRELGGEAARLKARELVQAWFDGGRPGGGAAADITARRVVHWIGHFSFFCASADDDFRRAFMAQIAADAANLRRTLSLGQTGSSPLVVFKGVLWATLFLTGGLDGRRHFERWLGDALAASFDANGGPIDRAPDSAARALADLIDIRQAYRAAGHEEPEPVASAIEAATSWVRMMRHGDGGLACFNGAAAMSGPDLDHLLTVADSKARALREAPDSGYMRLVGGRTVVVIDGGVGAVGAARSHAAPLAFEMSVGRQRLVVNCGAADYDDRWSTPLRATAAHSTLIVDDCNAVAIAADGRIARRPDLARVRRDVAERNQWFEGEHDGYAARYGVVHRRRLFLAAAGGDLRGEDMLVYGGGPSQRGKRAVVRFHLHPRVSASLVQNGTEVLLRLPSGTGWRFRVAGGAVALHDSVYFGDGGLARCQQIVVDADLDTALDQGTCQIRWAFRREG
ncbi:MAG: heparinase II/III family protein [Pseudomonadota bacterium]|nr:heparinase II/III family protein [Pseudomonadota bacterium]